MFSMSLEKFFIPRTKKWFYTTNKKGNIANRHVMESSLTKYMDVSYDNNIPSLMKNMKLLNKGRALMSRLRAM